MFENKRYKKVSENVVISNLENNKELDKWLASKIDPKAGFKIIYNLNAKNKSDKTSFFGLFPQNEIFAIYAIPSKVRLNEKLEEFIENRKAFIVFRTNGQANLALDGKLYPATDLDLKIRDAWWDDFDEAQRYAKKNPYIEKDKAIEMGR